MSVGGEAAVPPRPRPLAVTLVAAHPIRHFAKPPGVKRNASRWFDEGRGKLSVRFQA